MSSKEAWRKFDRCDCQTPLESLALGLELTDPAKLLLIVAFRKTFVPARLKSAILDFLVSVMQLIAFPGQIDL